MQETPVHSWIGKIRWRRERVLTPEFLGFPCGSAGKDSACNAGDLGSVPHSCILAQRIPWTVYPWDCKEWNTTDRLSLPFPSLH